MYGMNTAILTLQFTYRYLIVYRQDLVYLLKMKGYKLMWIVGILLWSMSYMFITFYCFAVTIEYKNYVRTPMMERLKRNIDKMSFFCVFPFAILFQGERQRRNDRPLESGRWTCSYCVADAVITYDNVVRWCENRSNVGESGDE
ncbi:unnamed protein product [Angiostrongylus costaricensis]|uniref:G_PROTEIN_RECEP_F1_2 domain-containing protein n=1 Tax=Angiostrongylus costaricensis TaxID=334426 RepID=A0A0R3Q2G5_ANGCS|nr:unnamed protein product [Angiostrongylus costaricensis]